MIEDEFERIRTAQKARAADAAGGISKRLKMWGRAFSTLFINLFRHADSLATAMDARCYGAASRRGNLHGEKRD